MQEEMVDYDCKADSHYQLKEVEYGWFAQKDSKRGTAHHFISNHGECMEMRVAAAMELKLPIPAPCAHRLDMLKSWTGTLVHH